MKPHDTKARLAPSASVAFAFALLVPAIILGSPAATASTNMFTEDWETGTTGWSISGSGVSRECGASPPSGTCALRFNPPCCGTSSVLRTVAVAATGVTTVSTYVKSGTTEGEDFRVSYDNGQTISIKWQNGNLRVYVDGVEKRSTSWSNSVSWMKLSLKFNPGPNDLQAELRHMDGSLAASLWVGWFWYQTTAATQVTQVGFRGTGNGQEGARFDLMRIDIDGSAPTPPQNVQVQPNGNRGELTITWSDAASNGGYPFRWVTIYRAPSATGAYGYAVTCPNDQHSCTDWQLADGTTYYYKMTVTTDAGTSAMTAPASGTTPSLPGVPSSFSAATGSGQGEIRLSWSAPAANGSPISAYNIYRSESANGEYGWAGSTDQSPYVDQFLPDGTTFYYKVAAVNNVGEGGLTASRSAMTYGVPSAPVGLVAAPTMGRTTLTWQAPTYLGLGTIEYHIYRGFSTGTHPEYLGSRPASQRTLDDTTCPIGRSCFYVVYASNAIGWGPASNEASAPGTTIPDAPGALDVLTDSDGDGYSNHEEVLANSDPTDQGSTPMTDDDCDGKTNAQERDFLGAKGVGHFYLVTGGTVTVDPTNLGGTTIAPSVSVQEEGSSSCA